MKGFKEFVARLESDKDFAAKFVDVKTKEEGIALAKSEGYDLEQLNADELDAVAGGTSYPGGAGQRGQDLYKAIKNLIALITGSDKVY